MKILVVLNCGANFQGFASISGPTLKRISLTKSVVEDLLIKYLEKWKF